jgi:methyl-accepting chemotaxis protein
LTGGAPGSQDRRVDLLLAGACVLAGLLVGLLLAALRARPRLGAARREIDRLERERLELIERLGELEATAGRAVELAARSIEEPARDAHRAMRGRSDLQISIARGIEELERALGVGIGKGATPTAVAFDFEGSARRVEQVIHEQEGRLRAMAAEVESAMQGAETAAMAANLLSEILATFDRGADAVAASAGETSDAVAQLAGAQRRLQGAAGEAASFSSTVSGEAERGYRAVHHTLDEIDRIRELADAARGGIEALAARMVGVGEVVRVIQEIAEKTNLLALNASIIAAGAGEHGRSFAVVAQEIKALAQRTASSTKQIGELIRGVREDTERAHEAMTAGVAAVAQGFQVALGAGDALGEIRQSARVAQKKVQSMMRAVDEEASAAARMVAAGGLLGERATSLSEVIREQAMHRARLADGAAGFTDSAARLARLAREQLEGSRLMVDVVERIASETQGLTRGQKELRRHVDRIHVGAAQLSGLESQVAEHIAGVSDAAVRLREELARLQIS